MMKGLWILIFTGFFGSLVGQSTDTQGYYLFEPKKFSPPVKEMIASYEEFPAIPFMAKNLDGKELYIGDFKGKPLILLFWSTLNPVCLKHLDDLNRLSNHFKGQMEIVSFSDEDRKTMNEFVNQSEVHFHVIPDSKIFGEAAYANELGYPRAFVIDASGIIRKVVPEEAFQQSQNVFEMLKSIVSDYL